MSSVNKKEIEKFSKMATEWWDPNGKFKPLHKFNPIRIKYIKENIPSPIPYDLLYPLNNSILEIINNISNADTTFSENESAS